MFKAKAGTMLKDIHAHGLISGVMMFEAKAGAMFEGYSCP
jgi:hypothetical protein